jgi:hypothetical protein
MNLYQVIVEIFKLGMELWSWAQKSGSTDPAKQLRDLRQLAVELKKAETDEERKKVIRSINDVVNRKL